MTKYEENRKKYEEICEKYGEICGSGNWKSEAPSETGASHDIHLPSYIKALELGIIPSSPNISAGTWKNCELHPL